MKSDRTNEAVKQELNDHYAMISIYHTHIIKPIYDELCKIPALGHVWVMEGGGAQCQAFFGNEKGYIVTLGLDMKSKNKKEVTKSKDYTLVVEGKRNDDILEKVTLPNCKVRLCREQYKGHLDTIDYYKEEAVEN